ADVGIGHARLATRLRIAGFTKPERSSRRPTLPPQVHLSRPVRRLIQIRSIKQARWASAPRGSRCAPGLLRVVVPRDYVWQIAYLHQVTGQETEEERKRFTENRYESAALAGQFRARGALVH